MNAFAAFYLGLVLGSSVATVMLMMVLSDKKKRRCEKCEIRQIEMVNRYLYVAGNPLLPIHDMPRRIQ